MIAESGHASQITEILPLGFGKCSLQVQVPVKSPFQTVEDLVGRRVATSFEVLAGELFGKLDKEAGEGKKTQVEYVGGSVEAACALGMADGIGMSFLPGIGCGGNSLAAEVVSMAEWGGPSCSSENGG